MSDMDQEPENNDVPEEPIEDTIDGEDEDIDFDAAMAAAMAEAEAEEESAGLELDEMQVTPSDAGAMDMDEKKADDLEAVFDVPVRISAVLGKTKMPIADLLNLDSGTVLELDKQVGEPIDIYINSRLVARGEVVLVEEKLGVTMTEIIKAAS